jgi:ATP adenylyltransferase
MTKQASSQKPLVDLSNARFDDQRQQMQEILDAGHCPFCPEFLAKYHTEETLKQGQYWLITYNKWPYEHTKYHWMAITTFHAEKLSDLPPEAGAELFKLLAELEQEHQLPGGGFAMRFGDTRYSAGTIRHLHVQIVVPDLEDPNYQPVRIKIGTDPRPNLV